MGFKTLEEEPSSINGVLGFAFVEGKGEEQLKEKNKDLESQFLHA